MTDYARAYQEIFELLRRGVWSVGEAIPSITRLSVQIGIGRISVQHAVKRLVEEGILNAVPCSGTYVLRRPSEADSSQMQEHLSWQEQARLIHGVGVQAGDGLTLRMAVVGEKEDYGRLWRKLQQMWNKGNNGFLLDIVFFNTVEEMLLDLELDIIQMPGWLVQEMVDEGYIYHGNCNSDLGFETEAFYPGCMELGTRNGKQVALPLICALEVLFSKKQYASRLRFDPRETDFWGSMERLRIFADTHGPIGSYLNLQSYAMLSGYLGASSGASIFDFRQPGYQSFLQEFAHYMKSQNLFPPSIGDPYKRFANNEVDVTFGSSIWAGRLAKEHDCLWAIGSVPRGENGNYALAANLYAVSADTLYPDEASVVLAWLAGESAQSVMSSGGRLVANRKANQQLVMSTANDDSAAVLSAMMEHAEAPVGMGPKIAGFALKEFGKLTEQWRRGCISTEQFVEAWIQRYDRFVNAMMHRKEKAAGFGSGRAKALLTK